MSLSGIEVDTDGSNQRDQLDGGWNLPKNRSRYRVLKAAYPGGFIWCPSIAKDE
jgi:hypothetical protein